MKKTIVIITLSLILIHFPIAQVVAQTEVSGQVFGSWSLEGSPFLVTDEISVSDTSQLSIEAGVEVLFQADVPFEIYGTLLAEGDVNDSIFFTTEELGQEWGGIRLYEANEGTLFEYCRIDGGSALAGDNGADSVGTGGNMFVYSGDVTLSNCVLSNGTADRYGGGIGIWSANTIIRNCEFTYNSAEFGGGALLVVYDSDPVLENCIFLDNTSPQNGGALLTAVECQPVFTNCTFDGNRAHFWGGAALIAFSSQPEFYNCSFVENSANVGGALNIRGENTTAMFDWCYFYGNVTNGIPRLGGAVYIRDYATPEFRYCRFESNVADHGGALYCKEEPRANIHHNLFVRNGSTHGGAAIEVGEDNGDIPLLINNSTFIDNHNTGLVPDANTAFARNNSSIRFSSCIIRSESPQFAGDGEITLDYSHINGGYEGEENSALDPDFFDLDSTWFLINDNSSCFNSGNPDLNLDPDSTINDRGWMHFPVDLANDQIIDIYSMPTIEERLSEPYQFINHSNVPVYITPTDLTINDSLNLIELSQEIGDSSLRAVLKIDDLYYIAGSNNDADPNLIYVTHLPFNGEIVSFEQPGGSRDEGFLDLATDGGDIIYGCYDNYVVEFSIDGEFGDRYRGPSDIGNYTGLTVDYTNAYQFIDYYIGSDEGIIVRVNSEFGEEDRYDLGKPIRSLGMKHNERALYVVSEDENLGTTLSIYYPDEARHFDLSSASIGDSLLIAGFEIAIEGEMIAVVEGMNGTADSFLSQDMYVPWLVTPHRWQLVMPGDSARWEFIFNGRQMDAGDYSVDRSMMINGAISDYTITAHMNSLEVRAESVDYLFPNSPHISSTFPNPFNAQLNVRFSLPIATLATLEVIDLFGRQVRMLEQDWFTEGNYNRVYDLSDIPSGSYLLKISTADYSQVCKVVLTK